MKMSENDSWSLSKFDLAAKLQACEIELQYTKEELERRKQEIRDYNIVIEKREQQIKAQSCRQRQIENLHKELIQEYEQHVACLKQEVKEIKESHDKLLLKFKDMQQHKQTPKNSSDSSALLSAKLIEITNTLENLYQTVPSNIFGQSNTLEILQKIMNGHCIYLCDEMLKRPLSAAKVQFLEETVLQFIWLVNETQQRLQEMAKELKMLSYAAINTDLSGTICKSNREDVRRNPSSNLDWNKVLDSKVSIEKLLTEETIDAHDFENRIQLYLNVLEKLIEQKSKRQILCPP